MAERRILVELYRHNAWANLALLDACAGLTDVQLDVSAAGTYGRLRDTLVHICAAEERYVTRLTSERPEKPLREADGFPGFDDLRERSRASGEALVAIATGADVDWMVTARVGGEERQIGASVVLTQAINHATEHRQQAMTAMAQQGLSVPDLSGWAYAETVR